jgi:hypothetical protein
LFGFIDAPFFRLTTPSSARQIIKHPLKLLFCASGEKEKIPSYHIMIGQDQNSCGATYVRPALAERTLPRTNIRAPL